MCLGKRPLSVTGLTRLTHYSHSSVRRKLVSLVSSCTRHSKTLRIIRAVSNCYLRLGRHCQFLISVLVPLSLKINTLHALTTVTLGNPVDRASLISLQNSKTCRRIRRLLTRKFIHGHQRSSDQSSLIRIARGFCRRFRVSRLPRLHPGTSRPDTGTTDSRSSVTTASPRLSRTSTPSAKEDIAT